VSPAQPAGHGENRAVPDSKSRPYLDRAAGQALHQVSLGVDLQGLGRVLDLKPGNRLIARHIDRTRIGIAPVSAPGGLADQPVMPAESDADLVRTGHGDSRVRARHRVFRHHAWPLDPMRDHTSSLPEPAAKLPPRDGGSVKERNLRSCRGAVMRLQTGRTAMPRQIITTTNAPGSPLYSQGVKAGPYVLVSGMVGIDPGTGSLAGDTIQDQTRQALTNCEAILQAGGASLDDVIEAGILLTNPADFTGLNEEYARWFPSEPPTRYVAKLGVEVPGLLVSIRMTAFIT
jgi:2-iminobutanoate/2-iminopropanoate deaminase